ncbi:hypothetical protein LTR08_000559 [Meristemomyces frigidus]|nr:hypothetical protein LTR08_000559 [Meristemomyces frigidus]
MFSRHRTHSRDATHICDLHFTTGTEHWNLKRHYLPQVKLDSHTLITPVSFTTHLTQTFRNPTPDPLPQLRYTFPLYDGVAVNGYSIRYAGNALRGVVKQKDAARKTYQTAVARGETAGLLEALPAGVFGITLGNVPARSDVVVEITYCGELKHDAGIDGLRWTLPTAIAPRYGDYPGELLESDTVADGGISITVDVDMASSAIRKVQSPSHPIAVSLGAVSTATAADATAPFHASRASATLSLGTAELAADFTLQLLIDDISKPQALLETHPTLPHQRAIMATLVPKFTLQPAQLPEVVFLADQSGSMQGAKNAALISAMKVFLKSLPVGVRFNICAFGSAHRFLWPKSQAYDEPNLQTAMEFVETFAAAYGGTEILPPVKAAFENRLHAAMPLEVMLLTDGEIWGEQNLFEYINSQIHGPGKGEAVDARVFALGIGGDVSHSLVEGVARAGKGFAQFVTGGEGLEGKVVRMLRAAVCAHTWGYEMEVQYAGGSDEEEGFEVVEAVKGGFEMVDDAVAVDEAAPKQAEVSAKPAVKSFYDKDAKLDEKATDPSAADPYAHLPAIETPKILQAPSTLPPLFPFNRTTVYLLLGPESSQRDVESITLRARSADGPLELVIPVHKSALVDGVPTIHQLAARKAVQELEEGRGWLQAATEGEKYASDPRCDEIVEREAVRLGETFQVVGKWTSFVAVGELHGRDAVVVENAETDDEGPPPSDFFGQASVTPGASSGGLCGASCFMSPASVTPGACATPSGFMSPASVTPGALAASGLPVRSSTASTAVMHTLIALQTFSGAWPSTGALYAALAIADPGAVELAGCGGDNAKATALAIAYLETRVPGQRDVWEMVVTKGRLWLAGQMDAAVGEALEGVIREAAAYV